jgi:phosphatidylinositol alpha-1,6-mannosyltransferase
MTTRGVGVVDVGVSVDAIYEPASSYAPSLLNNVRAAKHLLLEKRADIWNFVFAPNKKSSQIGRLLRTLRRVPVVQTIASRPKVFADPASLLFGDVVVAQSHDTLARFEEALAEAGGEEAKRPRFAVIAPPLGDVRVPTLEETSVVRRELRVSNDVPLLLYPGDLEVSKGAVRVMQAVGRIVHRHPTAVVVFAYRNKTPHAETIAMAHKERLERLGLIERVRFVREAADILALVRTSAALLFPVDELYGKVDIPIVLLEAMALGTPVVTYGEGPLADLEGVERIASDDEFALADTAVTLIDDHVRRHRCIEAQYRAVEERFCAASVARAYERLYDELMQKSR